MPRTAKEVRAAAQEFKDATAAYDAEQAAHPGEEPSEETSERLSKAYYGLGETLGIGFATDEGSLVELLLEILPEPAPLGTCDLSPSTHPENHEFCQNWHPV